MTPLIRTLAHRAIEDAALDQFLRVGFEATDLAGVAGQAQTTLADLTERYPDKEALLKSITDRAFSEVERVLDGLPIVAAPSRAHQEHALRELVAAFSEHQHAFRLISRFTTEHTIANLGRNTQALHYQAAVRLGGAAVDATPEDRVRIAATIGMLVGTLSSRITVSLDSDIEREVLVQAALAALNS